MLQLLGERGTASPAAEGPTRHAYLVNGRCFATSGDLQLWHRRLRHMDKERLLQIFKHNLVDGFKLTGRVTTTCDCETCRQAKIKRWSMPSAPDCLSHTIHSDLKVLPCESFRGYKYVINFVDSFSRVGFCYFLRSKKEVIAAFRQYTADMKRFGVRIRNLRTDRGSEYFEQEGDALFNRERLLHQFSVVCKENDILHILRPVGRDASDNCGSLVSRSLLGR